MNIPTERSQNRLSYNRAFAKFQKTEGTVQPRKLDFVDSLRGVAALYVLVYHLSLVSTPNAVAPDWIAPITGAGGSGVVLFFALSAFTLCLSMEARKADEATPTFNYYLRRFFRIAPLFYVWIVLQYVRDIAVKQEWHSASAVLKSFTFSFNFFPGYEQGIVWASWTIGVEMAFYVIFPIIFARANNIGKAIALFLATVLLRMMWHTAVVQNIADLMAAEKFYSISLLHQLPNFLLGIVVYHAYRVIDREAAQRHGIGYMLIALSLAAFIGLVYGGINLNAFGDQSTVVAFMFSVLILGASITAPALLVNRITRFLGRISYSVYLSHAAIIFFLSPVFARFYRHFHSVEVAYGLSLATTLAIVVPFSYLTYRLIEQPGNRLGRSAIAWFASRRVNQSSAQAIPD